MEAAIQGAMGPLQEAEQTLQKARVIEGPALRDELRQEQSRAAASDALAAFHEWVLDADRTAVGKLHRKFIIAISSIIKTMHSKATRTATMVN